MPVYRYFESLIDPLREQPADQPPQDTWAFFWYYLSPIKGVVVVTLLLAGIASISELYVYIYLGQILDWMSTAERSSFLETYSVSLMWMLFVVVIIRPASLLGTRALINLALAPGLANATRWQNHRYVLRQSMTFFQNDFAGRIAQKVLQTGHAVREAVLNIVDGAWMLLIYVVGIAAFLLDANAQLLWPIAIWSAGYLAVILFMVPPVRRKSGRLSEANSVLMGRVVDSYTNIQAVKLFAHHNLEEEFAGQGIRLHTRAFQVLMRSILSMTLTLTALNTLLVAGTAALSIHLWLQSSVSIGEIAVANGLVLRLNQMSGWVLRTITSLFENVGTVQNGIETISQPMQISDQPDAGQLKLREGRVEFDRVSFSYDTQSGELERDRDNKADSEDKPAQAQPYRAVVRDCTFEIGAGEKVGLVGRSGAGKSTLVNLLMRFHDVDSGTIRIDGEDISQLTQDSLRSAIAVVTQDTSLLHRSIRENIRYGRADASDEQILMASKQAHAMEFIPQLSDPQGRTGLDALVGERGVKLSGGQRQRIAIARVVLKDAPILILDEATSALDSEVEAAIQQQMTQLMQGKTVLAVAHRLSTIAALDRLIVLDEGRIVEQGTHQQLIGSGGLYAKLWERQSGGFLGLG